jgi:hypothetical protein
MVILYRLDIRTEEGRWRRRQISRTCRSGTLSDLVMVVLNPLSSKTDTSSSDVVLFIANLMTMMCEPG